VDKKPESQGAATVSLRVEFLLTCPLGFYYFSHDIEETSCFQGKCEDAPTLGPKASLENLMKGAFQNVSAGSVHYTRTIPENREDVG
jgi:hypothetical protein